MRLLDYIRDRLSSTLAPVDKFWRDLDKQETFWSDIDREAAARKARHVSHTPPKIPGDVFVFPSGYGLHPADKALKDKYDDKPPTLFKRLP